MEEGGGIESRGLQLLDKMSAAPDRRDHLAGLTLDAILANNRVMQPPPPPTPPETSSGSKLLDVTRDEDTVNRNVDQKDRRSWKIFRERLRMKRAGAAWTSSVNIPASDVPIMGSSNRSSQLSRRASVRLQTSPLNNLDESTEPEDPAVVSRPQFMRHSSSRFATSPIPIDSTQKHDTPDISLPSEAPPSRNFKPQMSRRTSTRITSSNPESSELYVDPFEVAREGTRRLAMALAKEKALSAREAVAAQEAAEAEAAAAAAEAEAEEAVGEEEAATATDEDPEQGEEEPQQVRMSLMDLLEETDRQMGLEGSGYSMGDEEEEEEEEEEYEEEEKAGGMEYNCCVCMVRHKGAALIPCGHTFCRLCSRELRVQRGNCPLCNSFILEILEIF